MSDHEKKEDARVPGDGAESNAGNGAENSEFGEVREEIVAYLDGELTPEQNAAVETRLAADDGYRHELLQLQRTWDMLDQLPRTTASAEFTQSTVEIAALKEKKVQRKKWYKAMNWRWIAAGLAVIFCGAIAYAASLQEASKPNEQLAEDLDLLHEFEMYEEVDSISFLRRLKEDGMFADEELYESPASERNSAEAEPTLVSLREMQSGELYQLKLKKDKFDRRPDAERLQYRELHQDIATASDREDLKRVLIEYNAWLTSVDAKTRSELVQLTVDQRVEQIAAIRQQQAEEQLSLTGNSKLNTEDLVTLAKWIQSFCVKNEDRILEAVKEIRARREANSGERRESEDYKPRFPLGYVIANADESDGEQILRRLIGRDEVESLASSFSGKGASYLRKEFEEYHLRSFMMVNMQPAFILRYRTPFSEEQLQQFFEEQLNAKQQSALDWLRPEERHSLLMSAYGEFGAHDREVPDDWDPLKWKALRDKRLEEWRRRRGRGRSRSDSGRGPSPRSEPSGQNTDSTPGTNSSPGAAAGSGLEKSRQG